MRIAVLTRSLPVHRTGGLETITLNLARGLAARGHEIVIITSAHPDGKKQEKYDGVTFHFTQGTVPSTYSPLFFTRLNRQFRILHEEKPFDLIHAQGFSALTLNPPPGVPLLATLHGTLFSETPLHRDSFSRLSPVAKTGKIIRHRWRILMFPLYKRYLTRLSRIFVDSAYSLDETLRDCPGAQNRFRVVPLGLDVSSPPRLDREAARARLGLSGKQPFFFTLSRLEEMKGIHLAIDALASLNHPGIQYCIGGEGRMRPVLERMIRERCPRGIRLLGIIPREALADWFTAADLFIFPEISHPAFGLVSIESLFHGTPVIASRSGAIPEIVTPEVGMLFERGSSDSLAAGLRGFLPGISEWRSRAACLQRHVIENYSLDLFLDRTVGVYREVLDESRKGLT